jgi:hypothetical protein
MPMSGRSTLGAANPIRKMRFTGAGGLFWLVAGQDKENELSGN